MVDFQIEQALEMQEKIMSAMGQEMTEEQIEMAKSQGKPSVMNSVMGLVGGLVCMIFPISAIVSLFLRKADPNADLV